LPITPGRLCVVGDPKQSIYRFRRADIALYTAVEDALVGADSQARVRLSVNFRSGRRIIDAVNVVFGGADGLMASAKQHGVQAPYVDLVAHAPDVEGGVHVFGDAVEDSAAEMWRQEAAAITTVIQRMLEERWVIGEERRPVRDRASQTNLHPDAQSHQPAQRGARLEGSRIRYQLESGSLIVATQEVRDLLNMLRSIDDPTTRSPSSPHCARPPSAAAMSSWCAGRRVADAGRMNGPAPALRSGWFAALEVLRDLHKRRQEFSVPHLIEEILASRLLRAAAFDEWRPRETRRRYRFVADQARELARSGRPTLHDAVEYLERIASDPVYDAVARDDAGDESCVRVMTIHARRAWSSHRGSDGPGPQTQDRAQLIVSDRVTRAVECV